jgi:hypothetical protein
MWAMAALLLGGVLGASPVGAAPAKFSMSLGNKIPLIGALDTAWDVYNMAGTDTGLPTGTCNLSPGLGVREVTLDPLFTNETDAFDTGLTVWVDDVIFISPDTVDLAGPRGQTLTSGPVSMSGLDVTVQYHALTSLPILRTLVTLHNPSPTLPVNTARVKVITNVGSDIATGVRGSSDGDLFFGNGDRWVVTSDNATTPFDLVNLHVLYGPANPAGGEFGPLLQNGMTELTVFACEGAGGEGVLKEYPLAVPPGGTASLLLFHQVALNNEQALADALAFDSTPAADSDLMAGLTPEQLVGILNWEFSPEARLMGGGPGSGTLWFVWNFGGNANGAASGGVCDEAPGLTVRDGTLDPTGTPKEDSLDSLTLFVDDAQFVAPLAPTITSQSYAAGPVRLSGLDVTVEYFAVQTAPTLRTLTSFTNSSGAAITVDVKLATNVGSDDTTGIRATSDGDLVLTVADRWVVSSDDANTPGDPVNTHVLAGPGDLVAALASVGTSVCDTGGTEGIVADFALTVPPGESRSLLFFNDLHATNAEGTATATTYDTNPATGGSLLTGLSNAALLQIVNWNFCAGDASLCEDGDACTADACGTTGGCTHGELPATASFLSVACRIDDLMASAQAGVPAGALQNALAGRLQSARTNAMKGEMLRGQGKKRPAKRAIGKAIKALKGFERKLTSRAARNVAQAVRDALQAASRALRTDLGTLKKPS